MYYRVPKPHLSPPFIRSLFRKKIILGLSYEEVNARPVFILCPPKRALHVCDTEPLHGLTDLRPIRVIGCFQDRPGGTIKLLPPIYTVGAPSSFTHRPVTSFSDLFRTSLV